MVPDSSIPDSLMAPNPALSVQIDHAVFESAVEVPVPTLLRVSSLSEVEDAVKNAGVGPARGQAMAVPVCRIVDGAVTEVMVSIATNVPRTRICAPANLVHAGAPADFMISIRRDYLQFVFPPSTNQSDLVQASRLGVKKLCIAGSMF